MLSIFDFDRTISIKHTFSLYQLNPPVVWALNESSEMLPGFIYIAISDEATLKWTVITRKDEVLKGQIPFNTSQLIPGSTVPPPQRQAIRSALLAGFDNPLKEALILSFSPQYYAIGKELTDTSLRPNLADYFKHDDEEGLSSVATFHNNHSLVAGFIAGFLKKELVFQENIFSGEPVTAIAVYRIEGLAKPFMISYIPEVEQAFQDKMLVQLEDLKNNQISHLYSVMVGIGLIVPGALVQFYDDAEKNFRGAAKLPLDINCYWVDTQFQEFVIRETIGAELADECRAGPSYR